jgi:hypothetical protein
MGKEPHEPAAEEKKKLTIRGAKKAGLVQHDNNDGRKPLLSFTPTFLLRTHIHIYLCCFSKEPSSLVFAAATKGAAAPQGQMGKGVTERAGSETDE